MGVTEVPLPGLNKDEVVVLATTNLCLPCYHEAVPDSFTVWSKLIPTHERLHDATMVTPEQDSCEISKAFYPRMSLAGSQSVPEKGSNAATARGSGCMDLDTEAETAVLYRRAALGYTMESRSLERG